MVNQYASWKYILLVLIVVLGLLYSAPNLYGEDPALQISHRVNLIDEAELNEVSSLLQNEKIEHLSVNLENDNILVRFDNTEQQLIAATKVGEILRASDKRYGVALNLAPATPDWLTDLNALPMYLGLDLRGGVHFLMEVDMESAIEKSLQRAESEIRSYMRGEKVRYKTVNSDDREIRIRFAQIEERNSARLKLEEEYRDFIFTDDEDGKNWFIVMSFNELALEEEKRSAIQQNISTLKNRVNELGVAEPVIQRQGDSRVVVQLPGVQDTVRAKEILGATATLEFRLVHGSFNDWTVAQSSGKAPVGTRLYKRSDNSPVLLKRSVIVTGDQIVGAASGFDSRSSTPNVTITMNAKGADRMSKITRDNIGKPMAVVFIEDKFDVTEVDGEIRRVRTTDTQVINVATIRDQLSKRFEITGLDSTREARDLALLLRAGALRAPMVIIEERTVGPSLGKENIDRGFQSVVIGFIAVLIFMAVYYRVFGLVANMALTLNLVLMIAVLSFLQATLTLPGIAGIVLTVGMAVDANVLIFERIREELRLGNTPQASIYAGYEKAFGTIADANITTLIAAIVLFGFGTGPIQGFAITLSIGIITSMITAIFGTRAVINYIYGRKNDQETGYLGKTSCLKLIDQQIDFMALRKPALIVSAALLLISVASLVTQQLNFGIDFTGGNVIEVGYQEAVELQPIRDVLESEGFEDAIVQHFGSSKEVLIRFIPQADQDKAETSSQVINALKAASDQSLEQRRVDYVGPQVGEELTESGGLAVLYALIAILIYVGFRFEYRFSIGAVAALIHDVTITLGIFSVLQLDFDLSVLAALLAVIGYSLNDTIVVFDRIRENFRKIRKKTSLEITNVSINQTISRTLMTSLTTLLVLISLFFLGGEVIHAFALALIIGVLVGTYSSIYVATSAALILGIDRTDLLLPEKDDEELARP